MRIAVLGPLQVDGQDGLSPRDRVVLSAIVVQSPEVASTDALADALWGERPPQSWAKVVQGCVVRLRRRLGAASIESGTFGYRLTLSDDELDHRLFERLLERAREALAGGDPARSAALVQEALDLWRGRPLVELEEWEPGRVEAGRLEGLRMDAEELRVQAEIAAGRASAVLERARALTAREPFREHRWALLATALYQVGRQPEALGALKRARTLLVDELGLDPGRELAELEQQLLRQDPALTPPSWRAVSVVCPYRGLLPYEAADADTFFGREGDVTACLDRLRSCGVLVVVGPSGVGKSSLVRAGVVAALMRMGTAVLLTTPGAHPMDGLSGLKPGGSQTLVVDQAEEAFTVCRDVAEREQYHSTLVGHVRAGGALVLSLRADHLGDLAAYPEIARVAEDGLHLLGPMSGSHLRSAIEGPARRAGLRLEPGLVDLLVREVEDEPGALPLLSHVLRETWDRREGPTLTVAGYRATGGIRGAVSQTAEELYDGMNDAQRGLLRSMLLRLVMPTEDGEPVRAQVPWAQVAVDGDHVLLLERLVEARLVSVDGDKVQIAHEALVRAWPRLRGWLDDDVDGLRVLRHLAGAAQAWDGLGRPDSELYRGARLSRALDWQARATPDLTATETSFLAASTALAETELRAAEERLAHERTINRRFRVALVGVCTLVVLALVAGVVAVRISGRAEQDRSAASLAEGSRRAGAQALLTDDAASSLLLSVAAVRADASPEALDALGTVLARRSSLSAVHDAGTSIYSPVASPDGKVLAVASPRTGVQLFDTASLAPIPFADKTPASSVSFAPDRLMAMTTSSDSPQPSSRRIVRLYDLPTRTPATDQLGGLPSLGEVGQLAFSRTGTRVAAMVLHYDSPIDWPPKASAFVWDLQHRSTPILSPAVDTDANVLLSPDGRYLYVLSPSRPELQVWDVASRHRVRFAAFAPLDAAGPQDVDLSPDGSTIAVAVGDVVYRFDTRTLAPRGAPLHGPTDTIPDIDYSHDGTLLGGASNDGSAVLWNTATGVEVRRFDAQHAGVTGVAFGADGRTFYTTSVDGTIMAWDLTGRRGVVASAASRTAAEPPYRGVLIAPDGHTAVHTSSHSMWVVDSWSGRTTAPQSTDGDDFVWSPDSHWLLSTADNGNSTSGPTYVLKLWDAKSGTLRGTRTFESGHVIRAVFDPSSENVYVVAGGALMTFARSTLEVDVGAPFAATSGARGASLLAGEVTGLVPNPHDGSLLILRADGSVARVDPRTGKTIATTPPKTLAAAGPTPVLSPSGMLLAAARPDGTVGLLDPGTLHWLGRGSGVPWAGTATFAPDGSQFASVSDGRVRLWDGRTGRYQGSVPLPDPAAQASIVYPPGARGLVAALTDRETWVVDTRTSGWIDRACTIAGRNLSRLEWSQLFPDQPYQPVCTRWPAGT